MTTKLEELLAGVGVHMEREPHLPLLRALGAGLLGATALTLAHEGLRTKHAGAPRMDKIGQTALVKLLQQAGMRPPRGKKLYRTALAGDLLSNGLTYALFMLRKPRRPWTRGLLAGTAMGLGAAYLPPLLGLGAKAGKRRRQKEGQLITLGLYTLGGLAAAAFARMFAQSKLRTI